MRFLLIFVLLLAGLLGAAWFGGERWLAQQTTAALGQREDVSAAAVLPLRQIDRIGMRADQVDYAGQINGTEVALALPWVEFWVPPTAPTTLHLTLPDAGQMTLGGTSLPVTMQQAQATLRLSPVNNLAVTQASLDAGALALGGAQALGDLSLDAKLVSLGHDAPRAAKAAYDVTLRMDGLDPAALAGLGVPALPLPGAASAQGDMRLWLTAAPGRGVMQGQGQPVQVVGFRTEGLVLGLGDLSARLVAEVSSDDQGRAAGRMAIYTTQSREFLRAAADAGLIPSSVVLLGGAMIAGLSDIAMTPETEADGDGARPAAASFVFPDPAEGEARIPIFLRDGRVFLGEIPVGPAPLLSPGP